MYAFCITEHINMSGCSSAGQLVSLSLAITDHQALGLKLALLVHVSLSSIMNNKFMFLDKSLKWLMETWIMWRHSTNTSLLYFSRCFRYLYFTWVSHWHPSLHLNTNVWTFSSSHFKNHLYSSGISPWHCWENHPRMGNKSHGHQCF